MLGGVISALWRSWLRDERIRVELVLVGCGVKANEIPAREASHQLATMHGYLLESLGTNALNAFEPTRLKVTSKPLICELRYHYLWDAYSPQQELAFWPGK